MGLDIAFNRAKALSAGLILEQVANGTEEDIRIAEAQAKESDSSFDREYIAWLKRVETCVVVPNANHLVQDDGIGEDIVVRANRWGNTYAPLTEWLKSNGITWSEF